jgi:GNAT superfamily N-acetyltransferase
MIQIRDYQPNDARETGRLIKDTYSDFNLSFLPLSKLGDFLGPFYYAESEDPVHIQSIHSVILSEIVLLAENAGQIVGVLRGRIDRLGSLFVHGDFHYQGIGRALVEEFESQIQSKGGSVIRVASTVYAVSFYQKMGYKKSTGLRNGNSFQGHGLPIQPMKKIIS